MYFATALTFTPAQHPAARLLPALLRLVQVAAWIFQMTCGSGWWRSWTTSGLPGCPMEAAKEWNSLQPAKAITTARIKVHQAAYHLFEIQLFDVEANKKEIEKLQEKVETANGWGQWQCRTGGVIKVKLLPGIPLVSSIFRWSWRLIA